MNTIRTLGFAAVAALSLGVGAAMAQEGPNDTVSGSAVIQAQAPVAPVQVVRQGAVQSGSSDVDQRSTVSNWLPGNPYGVLSGGG